MNLLKIRQRELKGRLRCLSVVVCSILICLTGCIGGRVGKGPIPGDVGESKLRNIEGLDLKKMSKIPTESPEEVRERIREEEKTSNKESATVPPLLEIRKGPVSLTLEQAREHALANNLGLRSSLITPAIASQKVNLEQARFDATFSSSISYDDNLMDRPGGYYKSHSSLTMTLPTGGSVSVGKQFESMQLGSLVHTQSDGVGIKQPLLKGAGIRVATAPILIARLESRMSEAQAKINMIRLLAEVEIAYWQLDAAQRELIIHKNQVELAQTQLENAEKLIAAGLFTKAERIRANAGLLARREALIVAETAVRLMERELKRLMQLPDLPVDSTNPIICETDWIPVRIKLDPREVVTKAMENRMELAALQLQLLLNDINIRLADNSLFPYLNLEMSYRRLGQALTQSQATKNLYGQDRSVDDYTVGSTLVYPFGNRESKAYREASRLEKLKTMSSKKDLEIRIRKEVLDAVDVLERDWNRIIAAMDAAQGAKEAYEAEVEQNFAGRRTSTEVLEASMYMAQAESRVVRALADYATSKVYIALSTGTMLGFSNIVWEPVKQ
jgi:outer membrane protein